MFVHSAIHIDVRSVAFESEVYYCPQSPKIWRPGLLLPLDLKCLQREQQSMPKCFWVGPWIFVWTMGISPISSSRIEITYVYGWYGQMLNIASEGKILCLQDLEKLQMYLHKNESWDTFYALKLWLKKSFFFNKSQMWCSRTYF